MTVNNNLPAVEIRRKDYETCATIEKHNKKLIAGSMFISNLRDLEKYTKIYPNT